MSRQSSRHPQRSALLLGTAAVAVPEQREKHDILGGSVDGRLLPVSNSIEMDTFFNLL